MKVRSLTGEVVEVKKTVPDMTCDFCLYEVESICKIYGNERDFNTCVNFKWEMSKIPCGKCKHSKKIHGHTICDSSCGKFPINSGHPLSPCNSCYPEYDEDGCYVGKDSPFASCCECEVDEYAIRNGYRCYTYINWLRAMPDKGVEE